MRLVWPAGRAILVVNVGGTIHAVDGVCTHEYCELDRGFLSPAGVSAPTLTCPLHLSRFVERNHALMERILIITALYEETPTVPRDRRAHVTILAPDFYRVILRYGFMEEASIPEGLACAVESRHLPPHVLDDMTVFVGHETIIPRRDKRGMAITWNKQNGAASAYMFTAHEPLGRDAAVFTRGNVDTGTLFDLHPSGWQQ